MSKRLEASELQAEITNLRKEFIPETVKVETASPEQIRALEEKLNISQTEKEVRGVLETVANPKTLVKKPTTEQVNVEHGDRLVSEEERKLLHMEILLDNAQCSRLLVQELSKNPQLTPQELKKIAKERGGLTHPESADKFITQLARTKKTCTKALEALTDNGIVGTNEQAEAVYSLILPPNHPLKRVPLNERHTYDSYPRGKVRVDFSYPLAIVIEIDDPDDYKAVAEDNSGGFYKGERNEQPLTLRWEEQNEQGVWEPQIGTVPIIVMRGMNHSKDISHEKKHAEQAVLERSSQEKKLVWVEGLPVSYDEAQKAAKELETEFAANSDSIEKTEAYQKVMDYTLSQAKAEIIAYWKNQSSVNTKDHPLFKNKDLYQYLQDLRLDPESPLYQKLQQNYEQTVKDQMDTATEMYSMYQSRGLHDRADQFSWIMGRTPLQRWNQRLQNSLFLEEKTLFDQIDQTLSPLDSFDINHSDPQEVQDGLHDLAQKQETFSRQFSSECKENQTKPLIPILKKYQEQALQMIQKLQPELDKYAQYLG